MTDVSDTKLRDGKVSANTLIPLGNLLVLACGVGGGAMWCARMDNRVSNIEAAVQSLVDGVWSQDDMANWADLLSARNPTLSVPPVTHRRK